VIQVLAAARFTFMALFPFIGVATEPDTQVNSQLAAMGIDHCPKLANFAPVLIAREDWSCVRTLTCTRSTTLHSTRRFASCKTTS